MMRKGLFVSVLLICLMMVPIVAAIGEDDGANPPQTAITDEAIIINDEGGPVVITGEVAYTNPFFTLGTSQPLVILEDQAGFVDRNEYYLFPPESQVLGQITSDFYTSPFSYSLSLPIQPQGSLRDVDQDGETDTGVMVFAVAYWSNTFGDPFLERRDLFGGGWSGAYASTRVSSDPDTDGEIYGGKYVIYAPDANQGFPTGFGPDGKLFTADDPIAIVPQGYSVVDLDVEPFTFDRAQRQNIPLIEPPEAALDDFSSLGYAAAWDEMINKFRKEYAFTEYYGLNWDELSAKYRQRAESAELLQDPKAFALAIRDFLWEIPDGHVNMSLGLLIEDFRQQTDGGVGLAIRELTNGRVVVNFVTPGSPAAQAGIQLGAEIINWGGVPIAEALTQPFVWAHQALGTEHTLRLQQLRYVTRSELGSAIEITYQNPDDAQPSTVTLTSVNERDSFSFSSFNAGISGTELPVEFEVLPSGYGYVAIYSFSDDDYLTIQLWERMIRTFKEQELKGIIIDMRNNGGGSGFLADQMAAYFFDEELVVGNASAYREAIDDFYMDERGADRLYPPSEDLRWDGPVAVIVAPSCFSACEFFSYDLTRQNRAEIVGFYPTGGLGGSIRQFVMPEGISITMTGGRAVDEDGNIHIEGKGVAPTRTVPLTYEYLLAQDFDPLILEAENALTESIRGRIVDGGVLAFGNPAGTVMASGRINPGESVEYRVSLLANTIVSFYVSGADGAPLDTVLRVYDTSGAQLLAENDDIASGDVSSALEGIDTGGADITVLISVSIKETEAPGSSFSLTIESMPAGSQ